MKTKTAPGAAASRAKTSSAKDAHTIDDNEDDVMQLDRDEAISATTLTAAEKARHIQAAKAASDDEDEDDDMDNEDDDASLADDDDTIDDDELDKEFAEFDLPKSNRGGKKAGDDDIDDEFRDLGLDSGTGSGFDDDDDDF